MLSPDFLEAVGGVYGYASNTAPVGVGALVPVRGGLLLLWGGSQLVLLLDRP